MKQTSKPIKEGKETYKNAKQMAKHEGSEPAKQRKAEGEKAPKKGNMHGGC